MPSVNAISPDIDPLVFVRTTLAPLIEIVTSILLESLHLVLADNLLASGLLSAPNAADIASKDSEDTTVRYSQANAASGCGA